MRMNNYIKNIGVADSLRGLAILEDEIEKFKISNFATLLMQPAIMQRQKIKYKTQIPFILLTLFPVRKFSVPCYKIIQLRYC